jgi:hypothetical protein
VRAIAEVKRWRAHRRVNLAGISDRLFGAGLTDGEWIERFAHPAWRERVGTPEARAVLERMARGNPDAIVTRDAKSVLDR